MFIEIIIMILFGLSFGIVTGLIPGIHVNLISVLVLSFSPILLSFLSPVSVSVFLISLAITHSFVDSLPSIYLGAPDEAQALSVLPGHTLLFRGEGHNAILCTVIGSYGCLLFGIFLFPLFVIGMKLIAPIVENIVGYILLIIIIVLIIREKKKWMRSLAMFLLAGSLGILVLNIPNLNQPLFPLLSGLFGLSILIESLRQNAIIPKQQFNVKLQLENKGAIKSISAASFVGFIAAFLPGFGNSQAAIVANAITKGEQPEEFLTLVGGINTANMLLSIGTVFMLDKARNGAIVAVKELMGVVGFKEMLLFLMVALLVGSLASVFTVYLSKVFSKVIRKVDYILLLKIIITSIVIFTFIFDTFIGLWILISATSIGLLASRLGVGKNHLMGCLMLPVMLFFLL